MGTAEAYKLYDKIGSVKRPQNDRFIQALVDNDIEGMARFGGNALEKAAVELLPEIGELLGKMKTAGTAYCAMTGSGSAVFGIFQTETEAKKVWNKLSSVYWIACVHSC